MSSLSSAPVQVVEARPSLTLTVAQSLGELALVPPTASPQAAYERALALMEDTRKEIASVTSVKGPTAKPSASDVWLARNDVLAAVPGAIGMVASMFTLIFGVATDGSAAMAMYTGAVAAASVPPFVYTIRAQARLAKAKAKRAEEVLDTSDLERMLASARSASPAERAMIKPFLDAALEPLDPALSAKAAVARDLLLKDLPAPQGGAARAAKLAHIVDDLRHGGVLATHLEALHRLFQESPADERPIMAANLETAAFAGEKAVVQGNQHDVRRLYQLIEAGRRGEAMASEEA